MDLSVIIPTFNRCESLLETLRSLEAQQISDGLLWEIVVVDNNSVDGTKRIVHEFAQRSKVPCRYMFEPKQGRPYALNRGIDETDSELLAFTDDDVIADPSWVESIASTLIGYNADLVGGKILPIWLGGPPPSWLTPEWWGNLGLLDYGDRLIDIKQVEGCGLWGANQAVRRDTLRRFGSFCNRFIYSQDYDFFKRLVRRGAKVIYQPKAVINHKIEENVFRMSHFYRWHYRREKIKGLTEAETYEGRSLLGAIPKGMIRRQLQLGCYWLFAMLRFDAKATFVQGIRFWGHLGEMAGVAKARRGGAS